MTLQNFAALSRGLHSEPPAAEVPASTVASFSAPARSVAALSDASAADTPTSSAEGASPAPSATSCSAVGAAAGASVAESARGGLFCIVSGGGGDLRARRDPRSRRHQDDRHLVDRRALRVALHDVTSQTDLRAREPCPWLDSPVGRCV